MSAGSMSGVNCRRLKRTADASGERFERECLCQAGHAFEQHVAVGHERDEQAVHEMLLADDDAPHLLLQRPP
jgi:hypothetical protein